MSRDRLSCKPGQPHPSVKYNAYRALALVHADIDAPNHWHGIASLSEDCPCENDDEEARLRICRDGWP